MSIRAVLLLALALPGGPTFASDGRPLEIDARVVEMQGATLSPGVTLETVWELSANDPAFGGISGLLIGGGNLLAVTDQGHMITATFEPASTVPLRSAVIWPLLDENGDPLAEPDWDAEGLAFADGQLQVSFERNHRILTLDPQRRLSNPRVPAAAGRLVGNAGMEALATLPDGRLMALREAQDGEGKAAHFPLWILSPDGSSREGKIPAPSKHDVTGADIGPDGKLYVVFRHWSLATGTSIRIRRYALGPDGMPDVTDIDEIAAFDPETGIDNMEGLSLVPDGDALALWLIADDNFNPHQRTLLLRFRIEK